LEERVVSRPGLRELIGRAMVDEQFREELIENPAAVLVDFDLEAHEQAAIVKAATQSRDRPKREQARTFQTAMMKRWAT
jgi:hypothetical protein